MKQRNRTALSIAVSIMAACVPGIVAAQDTVGEVISDATVTLDIGPFLWGFAAGYGLYRLYKYLNKPNRMDVVDGEASFKVQGNGNCYINNVVIDGEHVADIEIINKNLYVNGIMKRRLASNSIIYNRGKNIFVDGKYVG